MGTSGAYSFYSSSDDGSRLFIDGVLILNNDGGKGSIDLKSAPISLTAGYHDIRVDYVQGTGSAAENLGWSSTTPGADVGPTRTVISGANNLYLAESNSATGASNAIKLGNNIQVTGNSAINLLADRNLYTQVELGGLTLNTGKTLTVTSLDSAGSSVDSNGFVYGAGKTVRFAGSSVFGNGLGTVTINSIPNVTFDGLVSDGGNNMNILWNNSGNLIFSQTAAANALGVGTTLNMTGSSTQSISSSTSVGSSTVILSTVGASPTPAPVLGSYVTGTGIPDGTRVITVTADQRNGNLSAGSFDINMPNTAGLIVGQQVSGVGIGTATITAIVPNSKITLDTSASQNGPTTLNFGYAVTLSANATAAITNSNLTYKTGSNLVLVGSSDISAYNPIGSASIVLDGGNLILQSKGASAAGVGPVYKNNVTVNQNATIQTLNNAATTTLGGTGTTINIANGTLTLDAIAGGQNTTAPTVSTDPAATLTIAGNFIGGSSASLILASTVLGANTLGGGGSNNFNPLLGNFIFSGDNTSYAGSLKFAQPGISLTAQGVKALSNRNLSVANNTLNLLSDGDGTGSRETLAFNDMWVVLETLQ